MEYSNKTALLIGAPSTGKTSVINELASRGYKCYEEISRQVTLEARAEGIEHLFKEDPLLFSEKLLHGRIQQFKESSSITSEWTFLDRGLPDITAYMQMVNQPFPEKFHIANREHVYDKVFWFPVWKDIHFVDNERYEDFDTACVIEEHLLRSYKYYNYDIIEVPKTNISSRIEFILSEL